MSCSCINIFKNASWLQIAAEKKQDCGNSDIDFTITALWQTSIHIQSLVKICSDQTRLKSLLR